MEDTYRYGDVPRYLMYPPDNERLGIFTILVPIIFVVAGVLYMIHQCKCLASMVNAGGGDDDSAAYEKVLTDLAALRDEHRTNQEAVKADIRAEMDALRKIQTDVSAQMGEIKTLILQLTKVQGNDKED